MSLIPFLHQVAERRDLNAADAQAAMQIVLAGEASQAQIAGFLVALRMKGESVSELVGFARAMRQAARRVESEGMLIDTCGTGGGGSSTVNISPVAGLAVARCHVRGAQDRNRSLSSRRGRPHLLETLGVEKPRGPEATPRA